VEHDGFSITDNGGAMWAMRKIGQAQEQIEANRKLATAEIEKIVAWNQRANKEHERTVEYMEAHLLAYYDRLRAADPKLRTLDLPTGKIKRRQLPQDYDRDDKQLVAWAEAFATDLLKVETAVKWGDLKKRLKPCDGQAVDTLTGEVIPGITPKPIEEKVIVEEENNG
jgi:seryl-tRNA synthetase